VSIFPSELARMSDTDTIVQDIEESSDYTVPGNGFCVTPHTPGDHRMLAFARSAITPQAPYTKRQPVWQHLGSVGAHSCNVPDLEPQENWATMLIAPSDQKKNTDGGFKRKRVESSADDDSDDNGQSDISSLEHSDLPVLEATPDVDMEAVD
jgi:hypothetical protein